MVGGARRVRDVVVVVGEGEEVGGIGQGLEGKRWAVEYDTFNERRRMGKEGNI